MTADAKSSPPATVRWKSNLLRAPLFFLSTACFGSLSLLASCWDKEGQRQHRIAQCWAHTSLRIAGAPVEVVGRENLLPLAVYASNHTSFMDTPVVFGSLPFQFRILAKESLWKWPFIGWHLNRSGQIPVEVEGAGASIAGLNRGLRALRSGMPLFIFPEGGRTADGQLQPFMNGPAFLSIRAQVPLIPMVLIGTFELLPIHSVHFHPRPVRLVIGKPIDAASYKLRQAAELTERLRTEIARLYDLYSDNGSIEEFSAPGVIEEQPAEAGEAATMDPEGNGKVNA